jgi:hypothetical protein
MLHSEFPWTPAFLHVDSLTRSYLIRISPWNSRDFQPPSGVLMYRYSKHRRVVLSGLRDLSSLGELQGSNQEALVLVGGFKHGFYFPEYMG